MPDDRAARLPSITKQIVVAVEPAAAFALFTDEIDRWWPKESHSVGESDTVTVVFERGVGGGIYERDHTGGISIWGHVREWDPPRRVVFTWHPGRDESTAQEVEVIFRAEESGSFVHLEHRTWESLGAAAPETHTNYVAGWDFVLGRLADRAQAAA